MTLLLALVGCALEAVPVPSPAAFMDRLEAESIEVVPAGGSAPVTAFVRTANRFGAAVDAPDVDLRIDDRDRRITIDALGYGELYWAASGQAFVTGGDTIVQLDVAASRWPGFGLMRAFEAPIENAEYAVALTGGAAVAQGSEVWWVGTEGRAHRVLDADSDLQGVRARHVDVDGILDVVAWTRTTVYLLRGRLGGGVAWGAGLQAVGYSVGGIDVEDLNGDNLPDLAVAWTQPESHLLDVWHGDGLWEFDAREPKNLGTEPSDVSIGDNSGEGKAQITVLHADGTWSRFIDGRDGLYMPVGPQKPDKVRMPSSPITFPGADVNGDEADELIVVSPYQVAESRDILLFELNRGVQLLPSEEPAAHVAVFDGDADGLADVWYLRDDRTLGSLTYDKTTERTGAYTPLEIGELAEHGPIAMSTFGQRDAVGDLFLAGNRLWWFFDGFTSAEDDEVEVFWRPGGPELSAVGEGVRPPLAWMEYDDDLDANQLVLFRQFDDLIELAVFAQRIGEPPVRAGGVTLWAGGAVATDMAVCGTDAYVTGQGRLIRVDLSDPTAPVLRDEVPIDARTSRVDCGEGPVGAVVVALDGEQIVLYDRELGEVERSSAGSAGDVAIVDLGSGPEIRSCDGEGCNVVGWSRADGQVVVARSTPDSLELVDRTGRSEQVVGGGRLMVADVDRDGADDLIAVATGAPSAPTGSVVVVHRTNTEASVPADVYHSSVEARGGWVAVGDADGDREPDLWFADPSERLLHTLAPAGGADVELGTDTGAAHTGDTAAADTGAPVDTSP
ncbi:MAG: hypothetical protein ACI8PZ_002160 [Myxococcota bacterium]|jgi:hypothetical protein